MVFKTLDKFEVKYLQILDESGKVDSKLMPKLSDKQIKEMYEWMVLTRVFDDKALKLQRQGRMGTYAPTRGQEAAQIGSAMVADKKDFVFPAFRETGVYLIKGLPAEMIYKYWAGDERGMQIPKNVNMFPISITVGAHMVHAVGAGMANNILKKKNACLTYFGDGATSEGDFHEAMNFAGVYKSPTVFICQNNQWAISLPFAEQTAAKSVAQKAIAYGFEGIQVDGNDIFAVYKATQDALKKAKAGKGPTLIECLTYRMADHTTSDDAKKYRSEKKVKEWTSKDPILRLKKYMIKKKIFSDKYEKEVLARCEKKIDEAVVKMEKWDYYPPEEIMNYMYASLTPALKEQQEMIKKEVLAKKAVKADNKAEDMECEGNVCKPKNLGKKKVEAKEKGMGVVGELEEA